MGITKAWCPACGVRITVSAVVAWPAGVKCECGSPLQMTVHYDCGGYALKVVPSWG